MSMRRGVMTSVVVVLVAVVMAAGGARARADVPPEPGYVEACATDKVHKAGETCESCGAWHGDVDACQKSLGVKGYTKRCRTRGASTWSEVWCKAGAQVAIITPEQGGPTPAPSPKDGKEEKTPAPAPHARSSKACAIAVGGGTGASTLPVGTALLVGVAILLERRRPR